MKTSSRAQTKVVIDTNILADHIYAEDESCSVALTRIKKRRHTIVVCRQLLNEYRGVLSGRWSQMNAIVDPMLIRILPPELLEVHDDPKITIQFGPPHDRYHMQLAIDAGAQCHITKDGDILAETAGMGRHGVREVHPKGCVEC